jgi:uncharacterized protein
MSKFLEHILRSQQEEFLQKTREPYVEREVTLKGLDTSLIQVVLGPRRAGKSFFCIHSMDQNKPVGYLNFDDERLTENVSFDELIHTVNLVYQSPRTLLLDEIQNLNNWELIVNRLQREGFRILLTGSNSRLLSRELATHLTGRHLATTIFPFSYREWLHWQNTASPVDHPKPGFHDFLQRGGFPEIWIRQITFPDYLRSLFDSIILRDIVTRYNIRYPGSIRNLAHYLLSSISGEFSYNKLSRQMTFGNPGTIQNYISYLEEAYLLFTLHRFSWKEKERLTANKKVYAYDNGYYTSIIKTFSPDTGKLLENLVAIELKRQETMNESSCSFWKNKDGEEVDFVIQKGMNIRSLIQVCADTSSEKTKNREIRALLKAKEALKCNNLIIVTLDHEYTEKATWFSFEGTIHYIPIQQFLQSKNPGQ